VSNQLTDVGSGGGEESVLGVPVNVLINLEKTGNEETNGILYHALQ
jgi:hypothetical protein